MGGNSMLGVTKKINKNMIKLATNHAKSSSNIAANRFLKKIDSNAFYRTESFRSMYRSFTFGNFRKPSFSWYFKTLKKAKMFKKPHRMSDLCHYCEHHKVFYF
jgi:hypothetical protein